MIRTTKFHSHSTIGVHLVSNIEEEYKTKFKGYGFVALGMDTTIIKTNINKLEQLWQD